MKYFKHMTSLRFEPEARKMIRKYGLEGFGLYIVFLETASESIDPKKVEPKLSESVADIAEYFNLRPERVKEMFAYALDAGILQSADNQYLCEKVHELLDEYSAKSSIMRESLEVYKTGSRSGEENIIEYAVGEKPW